MIGIDVANRTRGRSEPNVSGPAAPRFGQGRVVAECDPMSDRFDHKLKHTLESKAEEADASTDSFRRIELITGVSVWLGLQLFPLDGRRLRRRRCASPVVASSRAAILQGG
jgi:hypothetical protein